MYIENKKNSRGSGDMLPQKSFENLYTAVAILALFQQFLVKFCLKFLLLNLRVASNMMHFVHAYPIMRA